MDYKCKHCDNEFNEWHKILLHLKKTHGIKQNNERIHCVVNFQETNVCDKSYLTFDALRIHVKKCLKFKDERDLNEVILMMTTIMINWAKNYPNAPIDRADRFQRNRS